MKTGIELISEERARQIEVERFTPETDLGYHREELAKAAICYALPYEDRFLAQIGGRHSFWPFRLSWWKPQNRVRDLVKAGALIAAQIDVLQLQENEKSKL